MSSLALQLIAENKCYRSTFLDLGNCGLTEIPAEVGDLVWLEALSLADEWHEWDGQNWQNKRSPNLGDSNRLIDLAPLSGLAGLQTLNISGAKVTDLAPLSGLAGLRTLNISGTKVTDLALLAALSGLQTLDISGTKVTDLAPLAGLSGLQKLQASYTSVTDLAPLMVLSGLQMLQVAGTKVNDLTPLIGLSDLQTLDLSGTKVSDLAPLSGLSGLRSLNSSSTSVRDLAPLAGLLGLGTLQVSYTLVTDLAPLAGLSGLQTLQVSFTEVSNLAPLAGLSGLQTLQVSFTEVSSLVPLSGLSGLQTLQVSGTEIRDLAPLSGLSGLQTLQISGTKVSDLRPLAGLFGLRSLQVLGTPVSDLTPLAGLCRLQTLDFSHTQVSDLAPLSGLSGLQTLDISGTKVTDLSPLIAFIRRGLLVKWNSKTWQGDGICVENCPLSNPPPEIVNQGNDAILNYFRERELGGVEHLYEAKMLILGEGGAGKTSLLTRLYKPGQPLPKESETTRGISIYPHEFRLKDERPFRLNVWDFGGQQIYHATHQFFLTRRSLYVLVDDTRKDYKSVSDEGFKYWLELIDVFGGHSPTLIFQNEKDGRSKAIDIAGIKGRYDNVKEKYAGNLEEADAADDVRHGIEYFASHLSHIGDELPARWIKVRADIELRASETPYIPEQEYFDLYGRHIEFDRSRALLLSRYLHDLGVFLHFQDDPLLARWVILQNQWATTAVFCILDDETVKAELGRFNNEDCKRLWRDPTYADMHPELLKLMHNFELCYELRDSNPPTWLVPQLLPPAKPKELGDWSQPEDLVLRYRYEFLPKGVISRLTVRLHRFVRNPEMAWVTGVLFEHESTTVLAEVLANGSEIELRARGPERKALLSVIAADLDALNDSFQGLSDKVDKRIPCNCKVCRAAQVPEVFFDQKELLYRKEHNKLKVECRRSFENVDVLELLDGIRVDRLPGWATAQREVRIFLASSAEFSEDRDDFELYFRQQNDERLKQGVYLKIVRWENFLDAISKTRLQDEYNKAICECDVFVSLFFTRTGKYTEEEFDVAFREFKKKDSPRIFTYFKDAPVNIQSLRQEDFSSLRAFQGKLKELGHYPTVYTSIEDLKLKFRDQIEKILEQDDFLSSASTSKGASSAL